MATLTIAIALAACEPKGRLDPVFRTIEAAKLAKECQSARADDCTATLPAVGAVYVQLPGYAMPIEPQCVATLVSPNAVLTAAHCIPTASARIVFQLAGTSQVAMVTHMKRYSEISNLTMEQTDDIALGFLDRALETKPLPLEFGSLKPVCGGLYVLSTRGAKPVCTNATRGGGFEDRFDIIGQPMMDPETGLPTFLCHGDSGALVMLAGGTSADPATDRAIGVVAGGFELDDNAWRSALAPLGACAGFAVIRKLKPYESWILAEVGRTP